MTHAEPSVVLEIRMVDLGFFRPFDETSETVVPEWLGY
jgi:hypothetical protein